MMIPTMDIRPTAMPWSMAAMATPTKANGTENIITNGARKASNCDAITIYTRMTISTISTIRSANISFWSS